jgi:hypothetical protein
VTSPALPRSRTTKTLAPALVAWQRLSRWSEVPEFLSQNFRDSHMAIADERAERFADLYDL